MGKQLKCENCGKFLGASAEESFCYCDQCGGMKLAISDLEEENQYLRLMLDSASKKAEYAAFTAWVIGGTASVALLVVAVILGVLWIV